MLFLPAGRAASSAASLVAAMRAEDRLSSSLEPARVDGEGGYVGLMEWVERAG